LCSRWPLIGRWPVFPTAIGIVVGDHVNTRLCNLQEYGTWLQVDMRGHQRIPVRLTRKHRLHPADPEVRCLTHCPVQRVSLLKQPWVIPGLQRAWLARRA
jgi:hypothetical protein